MNMLKQDCKEYSIAQNDDFLYAHWQSTF